MLISNLNKQGRNYTKLRTEVAQISTRLYFASIGLGSSQHVEYDVDISIGGDTPAAWSITRRYRQFRDLHRTLAHAYGKNLRNITVRL